MVNELLWDGECNVEKLLECNGERRLGGMGGSWPAGAGGCAAGGLAGVQRDKAATASARSALQRLAPLASTARTYDHSAG